MATGNGAYIVHRMIEKRMHGYLVKGYHPNWTLIPVFLPLVASSQRADLVHTTPDYALFFPPALNTPGGIFPELCIG